jgi:nucleoid DNA-binding protein
MATAKYKPDKDINYIDQSKMARLIAEKLSLSPALVTEVIELEQKLTMEHVRDGYRVTKKNYISFTPIKRPGFKVKSGITGKTYDVPERIAIRTRLGQGFKVYVADTAHKMPEKICRFVDKKKKDVDKLQT